MVDSSYQIFVDIDATALEGGYVWIGAAYANPETSPAPVFWDEAQTIPAAQPLRTSGGYIVRDGTPSQVYTADATYSIVVNNRRQQRVFYTAVAGGEVPASRVVFPIPAGPPGADSTVPGPADSTYTSLAALKQAPVTNKSYTLVVNGGRTDYAYIAGDFAGTADDLNVVKLDVVSLTTGALVRQSANSISFQQFGAGAAPRDARDKASERVSVLDYRRAGDADDTAAFLRAATYCETTGKTLYVPAGNYAISDTITLPGSFSIRGEGPFKTVITMVSATAKPMFQMAPASNVVVLGVWFSGMRLQCDGGTVRCDGLDIRSGSTNSTIRQCQFDNLWIVNTRRGVAMRGVIYRDIFNNITVQGVSDIGFYSDEGFLDVTYNTFSQLEVTNVGDGAWAYYVRSSYSTFDTLTSDGVAYFSSPAGTIRNYTTETVQASSFPAAAGSAVVTINQVQKIDNFTIRGVDPAKRSVALRVTGTSVIGAMRMIAPHPINALLLDAGSSGTIETLQVDGPVNQIEQTHSDEILNNWIFDACFQVTKRSMRYAEGAWTPSFTGWTTAPTVNAATYERVGNRVTATLLASGGVADPGAGIGGLPVASADMSGGVATFSTSDTTKRIGNGGLGPSSTTVGGMGAISMAGVFWNMSVGYRA